MLESIDDVLARLRDDNYLADRELATATYLAWRLHKPLLIEGEPGVGKTSLAASLARAVGADLRTLQGHRTLAEAEWADFAKTGASVSTTPAPHLRAALQRSGGLRAVGGCVTGGTGQRLTRATEVIDGDDFEAAAPKAAAT